MFDPQPGSTGPATLWGCGFPAPTLFEMFRKMLPADSMTTTTNAARHGGDCCFFKDCAITANLCSSETLHKEFYEVAKDHEDLN